MNIHKVLYGIPEAFRPTTVRKQPTARKQSYILYKPGHGRINLKRKTKKKQPLPDHPPPPLPAFNETEPPAPSFVPKPFRSNMKDVDVREEYSIEGFNFGPELGT
jgi:hypothetical protein